MIPTGTPPPPTWPAVNRLLLATIVATSSAAPAIATEIGQPDFYGRLEVDGYPQPQLIYRQPITIGRAPGERPPIYLRVPTNHVEHWSKRCLDYNACDERVFFVSDTWYKREYVPHYRELHRIEGADGHKLAGRRPREER